MSLSSIGLVCLWLAIAASFYTALWFAFLRRFSHRRILVFNLVLSLILSPGILAGGHGAIPFPGGVAFLLGGLREKLGPISIFNFTMWMLSFSVFSVCSWLLKKR
jgi:hypothetical protein